MNNLIALQQNGLQDYLQKIYKIPVLSPEQELELAQKYQNNGDINAAHSLVMSHLKLAARIAISYRNYGLPITDLISEANIGLMQAVKKFDTSKGFRLSTYAMWWIKAALHEFILKSWSLVKIGTAAVQKRLFYNLNKIKAKLGVYDRSLDKDEVKQIATNLNVPEQDVIDMEQRLNGDISLNVLVNDEDKSTEKQDLLADDKDNSEQQLIIHEEQNTRLNLLNKALSELSEREAIIIRQRYLKETPLTLEEIGKNLNISRERVRQIETKAYKKLEKILLNY